MMIGMNAKLNTKEFLDWLIEVERFFDYTKIAKAK